MRATLGAILALQCLAVGGAFAQDGPRVAGNYLLCNEAEIQAAKAKAARNPWAAKILAELISDAEQALQGPIDVPAKGANVTFFYACTKDGHALERQEGGAHRCPQCGAVYRGESYDAVFYREIHSRYGAAVKNLGLAYRFTGRRAFADRAAAILARYADFYRSLPRRDKAGEDRPNGARLYSQTLNESDWLIKACWGYALIYNALDPQARKHIEENLLVPSAETVKANHWGIHNKQCVINAAFGMVGFVTGNRAWIDEAINHPERGFRHMVAAGATDEGMWFEGSTGYHYKVLNALVVLAEAARHNGIDLYDQRLRKMFEAPLVAALPDATGLPFNDNSGGSLTAQGHANEIGFARYGSALVGRAAAAGSRGSIDALLHGADSLPSGSFVPTESVVMPKAGVAVLRSQGNAVAVRFGLHGGGHGHFDKLNAITFFGGKIWGCDAGADYSSPLWDEWYVTTLAHNTVLVSQRTQNGVNSGKVEKWETGPSGSEIVVGVPDLYSDASMRRRLKLSGNTLEDDFEVNSLTRHSYHWAFHCSGKLTCSLETTSSHIYGDRADENGFQHLKNVRRAAADGEWWVRWEREGGRLTITMRGEPGTEVLLADGPIRGGKTVPMVLVHRQCVSTVFRTVHQFESSSH